MMTNLAVPNSTTNAAAAASTTAFSNTAAAAGTGTGSAGSTISQTDFLQLLTAQLKYQSPASPADPTQLASEFAQISEVNGINQLNTQLTGIQSAGAASQLAQASALVGKQVAVAGDMVTTDANGAANGTFTLGGAAGNVSVSLLNANGTLAATIPLGALGAGQQNFSVAGGAAGTEYKYQVNAVSSTGVAVPVTPYSVYTVEGVNVTGGTPTLNVQGSASPLPISSIATVLGG